MTPEPIKTKGRKYQDAFLIKISLFFTEGEMTAARAPEKYLRNFYAPSFHSYYQQNQNINWNLRATYLGLYDLPRIPHFGGSGHKIKSRHNKQNTQNHKCPEETTVCIRGFPRKRNNTFYFSYKKVILLTEATKHN